MCREREAQSLLTSMSSDSERDESVALKQPTIELWIISHSRYSYGHEFTFQPTRTLPLSTCVQRGRTLNKRSGSTQRDQPQSVCICELGSTHAPQLITVHPEHSQWQHHTFFEFNGHGGHFGQSRTTPNFRAKTTRNWTPKGTGRGTAIDLCGQHPQKTKQKKKWTT